MSTINVAVQLDRLFCFHGGDEDGDSEPYLWVIMFTLDGGTITQNGSALSGAPRMFSSPGSHGNLGSSVSTGSTLRIPANVGHWETTLQPIILTDPLGNVVEVPGTIGIVAVLMEENDTPNEDVEQGHIALNNLVTTQLQQFISSVNLIGVAAEVQDLVVNHGLDRTAATVQVITALFQPTISNLQSFAKATVVTSILQSLGLGGAILSALSKDEFQGSLFHSWDQTMLAATSDSGPGIGMPPIPFGDRLQQPNTLSPDWAYNLSGQAWQLTEVWFTPIPEGVPPGRQQVSGVNTSFSLSQRRSFVNQIGGTLPDGTAWWVSRGTGVDLINNHANTFFTVGADGSQAEIITSDALDVGHLYLTTQPDGSKADNLLSLPGTATSIRHERSTA